MRVTRPLKIGFLPFYVDYYESLSADFGPRKRDEIRAAREALAAWGEVVGGEKPLADPATAAAAGTSLREAGVDCVVALCVIAVFAEVSAAAIRELDAPLLLWHGQQIDTVDPQYSMVEIVRNTGQIGVQALANVLARRGRPFEALLASRESAPEREGLAAFFGLARAARRVRGARVLEVGDPFPQMSDVLISAEHRAALGIDVVRKSAAEIAAAYRAVEDDAVAAEARAMAATWPVREITADELARSARLKLAVSGFAAAEPYACATVNSHGDNCLKNPEIGITATYAISSLHAAGIPCSEVGDIPTALMLAIAGELAGDAVYTEVQVLDERRGAIVLANSGEAADGLRAPDAAAVLVGNANFRGVHGRGASFAYPLAAGPATVASLTPAGARGFHLVAMEGEILAERLPDTGAITGFFRPAHAPLHEAYRQWITAGVVHHAATCRGHAASRFRDLARLMGWTFTLV
jgi:L-arabinose isomerase